MKVETETLRVKIEQVPCDLGLNLKGIDPGGLSNKLVIDTKRPEVLFGSENRET